MELRLSSEKLQFLNSGEADYADIQDYTVKRLSRLKIRKKRQFRIASYLNSEQLQNAGPLRITCFTCVKIFILKNEV